MRFFAPKGCIIMYLSDNKVKRGCKPVAPDGACQPAIVSFNCEAIGLNHPAFVLRGLCFYFCQLIKYP
jgi:hypothetical protein